MKVALHHLVAVPADLLAKCLEGKSGAWAHGRLGITTNRVADAKLLANHELTLFVDRSTRLISGLFLACEAACARL